MKDLINGDDNVQLIAFTGTNASESYNRKLLEFMQRYFKDKATIQLCEIANIPLFTENRKTPEIIYDLEEQIEAADGIIIATPEYDHSIPAALKSLIEWLSWEVHPLTGKPVMIVGTSLGIQGTSRAQDHLRQILNAPGVDAVVMPGSEFLMPYGADAFDDHGNLKDENTVAFLDQCFTKFTQFCREKHTGKESTQVEEKSQAYAATYDVIVVGFGAAGATAARFAADNGAKVLLLDKAPKGHEGGNTRYAGQVVLTGHDPKKMKQYFKAMYGPINIDEEMLDTYVDGMCHIPEYMQKYFGIKEPASYNKIHRDPDWQAFANDLSPEYPEFPGADTVDLTTVHDGFFDATLWKTVRHQVEKRSKKIDVWLESPAKHLIQNPDTKVVEGVQVERNGQLINVRARNGVVLTLGGFENNPEMIQNFIGVPKLKVMGTVYNTGDGVRMAQEVGAGLWHMTSYEGYGFSAGFTFENPDEPRGRFILDPWPELSTGSILIAADDGSRYLKEDEHGRHGHVYQHGEWRTPIVNEHPYLIFDEKQRAVIAKREHLPYESFFKITVQADTLRELAAKTGMNPDVLEKTVEQFNGAAESGMDPFGRNAAGMTAFDEHGPYYATPLATAMLNTQGGARRNARAEVLDACGEPIPHLYSAGEFGGINANMYNGGGNLAECLIFGKIAGENAALPKDDALVTVDETTTADLGESDLLTDTADQYTTGEHQYIGVSNAGIGGETVVRVTYEDDTIKQIEVLQNSESADVGRKAIEELPKQMVAENTYDVDAVAGASASSRAVKEAVRKAIRKAR